MAAVLAKALEKLPADRFESAEDFRDALDRTDFSYQPVRRTSMDRETAAIGGAAAAARDGAAETSGRSRLGWALAAMALVVAAFGWLRPIGDPARTARLDLSLGEVEARPEENVKISRDGSMLAVAGGGGTLTLVEEDGVQPYDPHWGHDGSIVFTGPQGIQRVGGMGGEVTGLSGELNGRNPFLLPDGSGVLATNFSDEIHYDDLEADSSWVLISDGTHPWYVESGHMLFVPSGGGLFAVPFDLESGALTGTPTPVLDRVASTQSRRGYALSGEGTLIHLEGRGGATTDDNLFVIFDHSGAADTLGLRIGQGGDRGRRSLPQAERQLRPGDPNPGRSPCTDRRGLAGGHAPDGGDVGGGAAGRPPPPIPDGGPGETGDSVRTRPFLRAAWGEGDLVVSPDLTLAALESEETGTPGDVWIRTFPDPVGQWRVTTGGGFEPRWSPDGRKLYFWRTGPPDTLVSVRRSRRMSTSSATWWSSTG